MPLSVAMRLLPSSEARFFKFASFTNQSGTSFAACEYKSLYEFLMATSANLEIPVSTNTLVNINNTIPVERTPTTYMFGVFWVNMFREHATSELELVLTNLNLYKKHHVLRTKTSYSSKEHNCLHNVNYHMISQTAVCPEANYMHLEVKN